MLSGLVCRWLGFILGTSVFPLSCSIASLEKAPVINYSRELQVGDSKAYFALWLHSIEPPAVTQRFTFITVIE